MKLLFKKMKTFDDKQLQFTHHLYRTNKSVVVGPSPVSGYQEPRVQFNPPGEVPPFEAAATPARVTPRYVKLNVSPPPLIVVRKKTQTIQYMSIIVYRSRGGEPYYAENPAPMAENRFL